MQTEEMTREKRFMHYELPEEVELIVKCMHCKSINSYSSPAYLNFSNVKCAKCNSKVFRIKEVIK